MLTRAQALTCQEFHQDPCYRTYGPRGGLQTTRCVRVRRNGMTQTWKTRPTEWRLPVKYGIYARGQFSLTQADADKWHAAEDCPLQSETAERNAIPQAAGR